MLKALTYDRYMHPSMVSSMFACPLGSWQTVQIRRTGSSMDGQRKLPAIRRFAVEEGLEGLDVLKQLL